MNPQGGKAFGAMKVQQEEVLDSLNQHDLMVTFHQIILEDLEIPQEVFFLQHDSMVTFHQIILEDLEIPQEEFLDDPKYSTVEELAEKLGIFKKKYMEFDLNAQGDIDIMALKRMLEKMGAAKTHLELKKMITEVTGGMSETISYGNFVRMMLGKQSAIFKIILMYEEKAKEKDEKPAGPPPKKLIADLP